MEPVTSCDGGMKNVTTCDGGMKSVNTCDCGMKAMTSCDAEFVISPTPSCVGEFSREWIKYVMDEWFVKTSIRTESVDILSFYAALNTVQVMKR